LYLSAQSSQDVSISSTGVVTVSYTNNTNHFDMTESSGIIDTFFGSSLDSSIQTAYEANFIELTAGGFQVVSNDDRFVKIDRRPLTDTATKLLEVSDGHFEVTSRAWHDDPTGVTYTDTDSHAIYSYGNILPNNPGNGTTLRPFALGKSGNEWAYLNGIDITNLGVSKTASITGTTGQTTATTKSSYVKLPGGVICQWGSINDSSDPKTVTFPVQFPNSVSSVVCSTIRNSDGSRGFNHVYNIDRSGCDLILDGQYGFWMAWGH